MLTIQLLESGDTIEPEDLCRPLAFMREFAQSDYIPSRCSYSGKKINNLIWQKVGDVFGSCWFGKMISEYFKCKASIPYEFIRVSNASVKRALCQDPNDRYGR